MDRLPPEILQLILDETTNPAVRDVNTSFRDSTHEVCKARVYKDARPCRFDKDPLCKIECRRTVSYKADLLSRQKSIGGVLYTPTVNIVADDASLSIRPGFINANEYFSSVIVCSTTPMIRTAILNYISKAEKRYGVGKYVNPEDPEDPRALLRISHEVNELNIDIMYEIIKVMVNPSIHSVNMHAMVDPTITDNPSSKVRTIFESTRYLLENAPSGLVFDSLLIQFDEGMRRYVIVDITPENVWCTISDHDYAHRELDPPIDADILIDNADLNSIEEFVADLAKAGNLAIQASNCTYQVPREYEHAPVIDHKFLWELGPRNWKKIKDKHKPPTVPPVVDIIKNFHARFKPQFSVH